MTSRRLDISRNFEVVSRSMSWQETKVTKAPCNGTRDILADSEVDGYEGLRQK